MSFISCVNFAHEIYTTYRQLFKVSTALLVTFSKNFLLTALDKMLL